MEKRALGQLTANRISGLIRLAGIFTAVAFLGWMNYVVAQLILNHHPADHIIANIQGVLLHSVICASLVHRGMAPLLTSLRNK